MGDLHRLCAGVLEATDVVYMILYSNRTGSSLLTEDLDATGLGHPAEFFADFTSSPLPETGYSGIPIEPIDNYLTQIVTRYTAGRVFGFRTSLTQLNAFSSACSAAFQVKMDRELRLVFPNLRIILLSRQDKFAQAASYWEALQTRVWSLPHTHHASFARPPYNYPELRDALKNVVLQDWLNRQYLTALGCQYLEITYEQFVADRTATLNSILRFLRLSPRQVRLSSRSRSTEDDLTFQHARQLREDLKLDGLVSQ